MTDGVGEPFISMIGGAGQHGRFVQTSLDLDDPNYPFTWLPAEDHAKEASELGERGRGAFPD
jgi:hypothetical protein